MSKSLKFVKSIIHPDSLQTIIQQNYLLENVESVTLVKSGFNDTYHVKGAKSSIGYARIYSLAATQSSSADFEAEFLLYLNEHNISVSLPIKLNNGSYKKNLKLPEGNRDLVLFETATQLSENVPISSYAFKYGIHVGLLHLAAMKFKPKLKPQQLNLDYLLFNSLELIGQHIGKQTAEFQFLNIIADKVSTILGKLDLSKNLFGICHGDLHTQNIMKNGNDYTFIDFELCGEGSLLYDLGTIKSTSWMSLGNKVETFWLPFLNGYLCQIKLDKQQLLCVEYYAIVRQIWLLKHNIEATKHKGNKFSNIDAMQQTISFIKLSDAVITAKATS